jgi:hypothetical protein
MANQVFANGMEVSCKAADGKSICAFPDVCFTPPQTPATPPGVPIPYPNTGLASDTSDGSTTVKISGQEVMLKNKSYFKKSTGDEAGCAPMKGVVTHKITGKVYFTAWSMDVKVEGENVVRMMDLTTHNHGSCPGNTTPMAYIDEAYKGLSGFDKCGDEKDAVKRECKDKPGNPCPGPLARSKKANRVAAGSSSAAADASSVAAEADACARAVKCFLRPYKTNGENSCCNGQTGHHVPPWSTTASVSGMSVKHNNALCVCLEGTNHSMGSHGKHHHGINYLLKKASKGAGPRFTAGKNSKGHRIYSGKLKEHAKVAAQVTEAQTDCSIECIQQQIESQFTENELSSKATHNASTTGGESYGCLDKNALDDLNTAVTDRIW